MLTARSTQMLETMKQVSAAAEDYLPANGDFPTSLNDLLTGNYLIATPTLPVSTENSFSWSFGVGAYGSTVWSGPYNPASDADIAIKQLCDAFSEHAGGAGSFDVTATSDLTTEISGASLRFGCVDFTDTNVLNFVYL